MGLFQVDAQRGVGAMDVMRRGRRLWGSWRDQRVHALLKDVVEC